MLTFDPLSPQVGLAELFDFASGLSKPASEFGFGAPFLSFKEVFGNFYLEHELEQLVNSDAVERQKHSVKEGDVFLTRTSETQDELGMSAVALRDYPEATFNGFTKRLRPKPSVRLYPRYLAYAFRSPQFRTAVTSLSSLATRASLNNEMLSRLSIPCPDWETQRRIGDVLYALDAKVALNRRMNETLEAMARALFWSWFVDFDPVRAKSEGRPTGLPADLDALFPSDFEDSPLGEVPRGWPVEPLGRIADVRIGKTPPRLEHHWFSKSRTDVRWVSIRDLGKVDVFVSETSEYLTADAVSRFRIRVVPDRTVMVSFKLTVGRVAISDGELTTNEAIAHMIPQDSILAPWFLYSYLGTFDYGRLGSTSSIATAVNSDSIRELPVLVPTTGIIRAFNERVESLFQQILVNSRESRALEDMRCDLLPRLLSGEIKVAEAEVAIA